MSTMETPEKCLKSKIAKAAKRRQGLKCNWNNKCQLGLWLSFWSFNLNEAGKLLPHFITLYTYNTIYLQVDAHFLLALQKYSILE